MKRTFYAICTCHGGMWTLGGTIFRSEAEARALFESMPGYCESIGEHDGAEAWRNAKCEILPFEIDVPHGAEEGGAQ